MTPILAIEYLGSKEKFTREMNGGVYKLINKSMV